MTPLYGHTSPETAYVVESYPYGSGLRCRKRYWLEFKKSHGYRLVSQTTNPKRGDTWNKPHPGQYVLVAACMYLDDEKHVQWAGVGVGTDAEKAAKFVAAFPDFEDKLNSLSGWAAQKAASDEGYAKGEWWFTVGGNRSPLTDEDVAKHYASAAIWQGIADKLRERRLSKRFIVGRVKDGKPVNITSFDTADEASEWIGKRPDQAAVLAGEYYIDDREAS
jgi:hypothetical protein